MPTLARYIPHIITATILALTFLCGVFFFIFSCHWINITPLQTYDRGAPSRFLDCHGNEWARFELDRRTPIEYEQVPQHLIDAFVAAEDWDFFAHHGISFKGIFRSFLTNVYLGRKAQGASTITQQLVKLLFLHTHKTYTRKLQEQLYALLLERQCTKEQILQTYMNAVYFGCGIYGVEAACQRFWQIPTKAITLDQAALLAAIVCAPARYCPIVYPLSAERRRNVVLKKMHGRGFITQAEWDHAQEQEINLSAQQKTSHALYAKETVRLWLEDEFSRDTVYSGGLVIQTTLDNTIQQQAEYAFAEQHMQLAKQFGPTINGALLSVDHTGGIKALVGGAHFEVSKFNRALQARRQIGSVLKPLVYTAALASGAQMTDTYIDEPFTLEQANGTVWAPNNWNKQFNGKVTLAYALSHSNNIVTIKTFLDTGAAPVVALAKKCHISGPFHTYPSLALGCIDTTLQEAVGMFAIFANNGIYKKPHLVNWVKNKWGKKIWRHTHTPEQVIDRTLAHRVAKTLTLGPKRILYKFPEINIDATIIAKTGTTNDSRTCWFIGATPELTTGLYIGYDDNRSMGDGVYPIKTSLPIWLNMYHALKHTGTFAFDPSLQELCVNKFTGKRAKPGSRGSITIFA